MKTRTLIVDDELLARERVRQLLLQEPEIEIVGECSNGREAVGMIREKRARINLPHGFEYRQAEMANGTTTTSGAISLTKNHGTHAHICRVYMTGKGVINHAA